MKSYYWIKVRHSTLQDREIATLSDRLWRRNMELNLLAGQEHKDGYLPDVSQMAWDLRLTDEELLEDLRALQDRGLVEEREEGWYVTRFSETQAPTSAADRMRRMRQRKRKEEKKSQKKKKKETETEEIIDRDIDNRSLRLRRNSPVTDTLQNVTETVTARNRSEGNVTDRNDSVTDRNRSEETPEDPVTDHVTKRNREEDGGESYLPEDLVESKTGDIMDYFLRRVDGAALPDPDNEAAWERWIPSANRLLDFCADDVQETKRLIDQTLDYMDENGLTYSTPASLINVARTVIRTKEKPTPSVNGAYDEYKRLRQEVMPNG